MEQNFIILMVEDEDGVMDVNRRMLRRRGYDLKEAKNAAEAYAFLDKTTPDLLILDIMLPDGDGYEICNYFRKKSDNPVMFLTGKDEIKDKVKGLDEGCDYYLTKPYNFDEFLAVVKRLLSRVEKEHVSQENMNRITLGNIVLDLMNSSASIDGEDIGLTKKEFQLLRLFSENINRELLTEEIYVKVWGQDAAGDVRAVRKHIMNLRNKIMADDSNFYDIHTSYGKGYTFVLYDNAN